MPELYPYAAARIHARELSLLSRQNLEQLLAAKTYDECLHSLHGMGWDEGDTAEEILAAETEKTWAAHGRASPGAGGIPDFPPAGGFQQCKSSGKIGGHQRAGAACVPVWAAP